MLRFLSRIVAATLATMIFATTAMAQSGYTIRSGDTLNVEVLEDESLNRTSLVTPDGSISFPQAGTVQARGRTTAQVASQIADALSSSFASRPNVYVSVSAVGEPTVAAAPATDGVYVTGEIAAPGKFEVTRGTTVLQAIAEAGGLTRFAASKRIQLRRDGKTYLYNYETNGGEGSIAGNTRLAPGDVIVVPTRSLFE